jgi:hypothetical protein
MSFADALRSQLPVRRVGEVELFFEGSLYWGQAQKPTRSRAADLAHLAALALGTFALGTLLTNGSLWVCGTAALLSGAAVTFATRERQRLRTRRAFALNFATETLRLDYPEGRLFRPATRNVPFDEVIDLRVVPRGQGFALEVEYRDPAGALHPHLLVEQVPGDQIDDLRRLWKTLRNAFGLKAPAV